MMATVAAAVILMLGAVRRVDVYAAFTQGAKEGLLTALHTAPYLCAALVLTAVLRGSGLMEAAGALLQPVFDALLLPKELLPFLLLKPVSGSGALSALGELMRSFGADSLPARYAAAMMSVGDTVLYVASVYLGAAGMKRSRYVLPVSFAAAAAGCAVTVLVMRI